MRHIAARPRTRIELLQAPEQIACQPPRQCPARCGYALLPQQESQHVRDRTLLDQERAIHVGFAHAQLRIEKYGTLRLCSGKTHSNRGTAAVTEAVGFAGCSRDREGAMADEPPQKYCQYPIQGPPPRTRPPPATGTPH